MEQKHGEISPSLIRQYRNGYETDSSIPFASNVVGRQGIAAAARTHLPKHMHQYSHVLPRQAKCASQGAAGTCWLYAATNAVRLQLMESCNLEDSFELSQNYLYFWDKFEKANFYLETILETLQEPLNSRLFDHLNKAPLNDGGQYAMFVNLVEKYGMVPKSVFPSTHDTTASRPMKWVLTLRLRTWARDIHRLHRSGQSIAQIRQAKEEWMGEVYRTLAITLGNPPAVDEEFTWQYKEKKGGKLCTRTQLTPRSFLAQCLSSESEQKTSEQPDSATQAEV